MASLRSFLLVLALAIPLLFVADSAIPKLYRFDPEKLQSISRNAIAKHGDDIDSLMKEIVKDLKVSYGNIIEDFDRSKFVFNVAGGATGSMFIIHASITEYLIFFGSPSGTEGHSGVHPANDYFTILSGAQSASFLGEYHARVYRPGDMHYHPRFTSAHYSMVKGTWALELAQGVIPGMLPFGLIQMPLSLDFDSILRTVFYTGRSVTMNLLRGKL